MSKLSAAARKHIPAKDFALPGGRYPIEDASHARNALARVSQHGSPEERPRSGQRCTGNIRTWERWPSTFGRNDRALFRPNGRAMFPPVQTDPPQGTSSVHVKIDGPRNGQG